MNVELTSHHNLQCEYKIEAQYLLVYLEQNIEDFDNIDSLLNLQQNGMYYNVILIVLKYCLAKDPVVFVT